MIRVTVSAVMLLSLVAAGCTRAKAKTMPDAPPPLDVPAPPPRDVETTEAEPPPLIPLPQEPARNAPPRTRPTTPATRPPETRPEPPRPEPAPAEAEQPRPEETPRPLTLQTTPTQAEAEMERNIRNTITRATSDLSRVDYRILNADARLQYDTAKSFIDQAEKAIKAKNLVYAKTLADKAAVIATQLGGK
jgi:outer membrane biosynthesis protein TonB